MIHPRTIHLIADLQKQTAISAISNLPVGQNIEVVIREAVKARSLDQNALMWSGPLKDIAEQAWVDGRQFSDETWHHQFKKWYLPCELTTPSAYRHVKSIETYKKYDIDPSGDRLLVGSTKDLSKYGMSVYLENVFAFGGSLGVQFSEVAR